MYISPTRSAMIMSLEATSSALLAFLFLNEVLTFSETFGCFLMFTATIISTTISVDEEELDVQSIGDRVSSGDSLSYHSDADSSLIDFAQTADILERFLKTKQRSLHRGVVFRRSRSSSQSPQFLSSSRRGAESANSREDEKANLLPHQIFGGHSRTYGSL